MYMYYHFEHRLFSFHVDVTLFYLPFFYREWIEKLEEARQKYYEEPPKKPEPKPKEEPKAEAKTEEPKAEASTTETTEAPKEETAAAVSV